MTFFSPPATEKHQDICTIPLAAFDPVSWLDGGGNTQWKGEELVQQAQEKASKYPIFVFFVSINFWNFHFNN